MISIWSFDVEYPNIIQIGYKRLCVYIYVHLFLTH